MGKSGYQKCKEIMDCVKSHGFEDEITLSALRQIIMENAGITKETIKRYFSALIDFGFISTTNHVTFKIKKF